MDDKKKKYERPEAEVVDFTSEDIITESITLIEGAAGWGDGDGEDY